MCGPDTRVPACLRKAPGEPAKVMAPNYNLKKMAREVGEGKKGGWQGPPFKGHSCSDLADDIFRTLSRSEKWQVHPAR